MASKPGVIDAVALKKFVTNAGANLLVVDARNPNSDEEPGDQKSIAVGHLPSDGVRPQALLLTFDRGTNSMPLPEVPKDTPIITHCGGGGRGQKAKVFLEENGFSNVVNGGGPKETANWDLFGSK
jgi:rhodanese-related sulfurtransferase